MVGMIKKLKILLDKKQKATIVLLIFMMLIGAVLETLGVTLIIPVMTVVLDPSAILDNEYGRLIFESLNFTSERTFIIAVSGLLIAVFIIKNAYLYLQQKLLYRFIYTNQFRTSERMMKNYMRRPYEFFLNADTAVIQRSITSDVNNMYALLLALMTLCSELIVAFFLSAVLLFVEPFMTILLGVVLLVTMGIMKSVLKPVMKKAGEDNQNYYSSLAKLTPKIVPTLKPGAGVVTPRADVQWVVTEYGSVNLYGKSLQERARLLISIAHPDDREALDRAAFERFGPHWLH